MLLWQVGMYWVFWLRENINSFCVNLPGNQWCNLGTTDQAHTPHAPILIRKTSHDILEQERSLQSSGQPPSLDPWRVWGPEWWGDLSSRRTRTGMWISCSQVNFLSSFTAPFLDFYGHVRDGLIEKKRGGTDLEKTMNHLSVISNWIGSALLFVLALCWEADPGTREWIQQRCHFSSCLLCARHFSKRFTWINSFDP